MIRHPDEDVHLPRASSHRPHQVAHKSLPVPIVMDDVLTTIPAGQDMVDGARLLNSQASWHVLDSNRPIDAKQEKPLTSAGHNSSGLPPSPPHNLGPAGGEKQHRRIAAIGIVDASSAQRAATAGPRRHDAGRCRSWTIQGSLSQSKALWAQEIPDPRSWICKSAAFYKWRALFAHLYQAYRWDFVMCLVSIATTKTRERTDTVRAPKTRERSLDYAESIDCTGCLGGGFKTARTKPTVRAMKTRERSLDYVELAECAACPGGGLKLRERSQASRVLNLRERSQSSRVLNLRERSQESRVLNLRERSQSSRVLNLRERSQPSRVSEKRERSDGYAVNAVYME